MTPEWEGPRSRAAGELENKATFLKRNTAILGETANTFFLDPDIFFLKKPWRTSGEHDTPCTDPSKNQEAYSNLTSLIIKWRQRATCHQEE